MNNNILQTITYINAKTHTHIDIVMDMLLSDRDTRHLIYKFMS